MNSQLILKVLVIAWTVMNEKVRSTLSYEFKYSGKYCWNLQTLIQYVHLNIGLQPEEMLLNYEQIKVSSKLIKFCQIDYYWPKHETQCVLCIKFYILYFILELVICFYVLKNTRYSIIPKNSVRIVHQLCQTLSK